MIEIRNLYIYPIKSLRPISLQKAELTPLGLKWDRHWMLINEKNQFISQRTHPHMGLLNTQINNDCLSVSMNDGSKIDIPLHIPENSGQAFSAKIWNDSCQVIEINQSISNWFTMVLGGKEQIRLVCMDDGQSRPQSNADRFGNETTTLFADAVPYLMTSQTSLNNLNDHLLENNFEPSEMLQFRPNIVLASTNQFQLTPFQEHQIEKLRHQEYVLKSCDPCERCVIPTINLQTGEKHPKFEPYKTLQQINPMPNNPKAPAFGQNMILNNAQPGATIKVGDRLEVLFNGE